MSLYETKGYLREGWFASQVIYDREGRVCYKKLKYDNKYYLFQSEAEWGNCGGCARWSVLETDLALSDGDAKPLFDKPYSSLQAPYCQPIIQEVGAVVDTGLVNLLAPYWAVRR